MSRAGELDEIDMSLDSSASAFATLQTNRSVIITGDQNFLTFDKFFTIVRRRQPQQ